MITHKKLIVPLLDGGFTSDLFTPKAGFVDLYTDDINSPWLDNHVFLLYLADLSDIDNYKRHEKMLQMKNLCCYRYVRIQGVLLLEYAFCRVTNSIRQLLKGRNILTDNEKYDILQFWDNDHAVCMAISTNMSFDPCNAVVPEQDYRI